MAKKDIDEGMEEKIVSPPHEKEIRRVGIMLMHFSHASEVSPQYWHKSVKSWKKDQVIRTQSEIDSLISLDAPMEVFFQHVNGRSEN
jgi:hypothetical protein